MRRHPPALSRAGARRSRSVAQVEGQIANALHDYVEDEGPIIRREADEAAAAVAGPIAASIGVSEARLTQILAGALRSAHDVHGPIGREHVPFASRRAVIQLRAEGLWGAPR